MKRWFGLGMVLAGALVFAMGVTAGDSKSAVEGTCPLTKAANAGSCSDDVNSKASAEAPKACPVLQASADQKSGNCEQAKCDKADKDCSQCPAAGSCEQAAKAASADVPACSGEKAVKTAASDSCCASKAETASANSSSAGQKDADLVATESK